MILAWLCRFKGKYYSVWAIRVEKHPKSFKIIDNHISAAEVKFYRNDTKLNFFFCQLSPWLQIIFYL